MAVRVAAELFFSAGAVVFVDVDIGEKADQPALGQPGFFGQQVEQQAVAGDVKRQAEHHVNRALVPKQI